MSLLLDLNFDIDSDTIDTGGKCSVPGWYLCHFEDVSLDSRDESQLKFTLVIEQGPRRGEKIYDQITLPGYRNDSSKDESSLKRLGAIAQRFGLWSGKPGQCQADWSALIGQKAVVELAKRTYDDSNGERKEHIGPTFAGIMPIDHYKIPDSVRSQYRLPPAKAKVEKDSPGQTTLFSTKTSPAPTGTVPASSPVDLSDL